MKNHPTVVGSEIVIDTALKFLALEKWTCFVREFVQMGTNASATRIRDWIYTNFDFVDIVKERVKQSSSQILVPDFFAHKLI